MLTSFYAEWRERNDTQNGEVSSTSCRKCHKIIVLLFRNERQLAGTLGVNPVNPFDEDGVNDGFESTNPNPYDDPEATNPKPYGDPEATNSDLYDEPEAFRTGRVQQEHRPYKSFRGRRARLQEDTTRGGNDSVLTGTFGFSFETNVTYEDYEPGKITHFWVCSVHQDPQGNLSVTLKWWEVGAHLMDGAGEHMANLFRKRILCSNNLECCVIQKCIYTPPCSRPRRLDMD